jgi:tetratricopeptide (TPR) repeat protein
MNAGKAEFDKGNYEEAISYFETAKACDDKPGYLDINIWIDKSESKKKETCFNSYFDKGESLYESKDYTHAIRKFEEAKKCNVPHLNNKADEWIDNCNVEITNICFKNNLSKGQYAYKNEDFETAILFLKEAKKCGALQETDKIDELILKSLKKINWVTEYDGKCDEIIEIEDNYFIVAGTKEINERNYIWIVKLDFKGEVVWDKTFYKSQRPHFVNSISVSKDNGYFITGGTSQEHERKKDRNSVYVSYNTGRYILSLDSMGNQKWIKKYDSGYYKDIGSLKVLEIGNGDFLCSYFESYSPEMIKSIIYKLDSDGNEILDIAIDFYVKGMFRITDDEFIVVGFSKILLMDNKGIVIESKNYEKISQIIQIDDGFIVCCKNGILKLDNRCKEVWKIEPANETATFLQQDDNNTFVAGFSNQILFFDDFGKACYY